MEIPSEYGKNSVEISSVSVCTKLFKLLRHSLLIVLTQLTIKTFHAFLWTHFNIVISGPDWDLVSKLCRNPPAAHTTLVSPHIALPAAAPDQRGLCLPKIIH